MKTELRCGECEYAIEVLPERVLMNNIVMWNHSKKAHPLTAERVMRMYETLPHNLYTTAPVAAAAL